MEEACHGVTIRAACALDTFGPSLSSRESGSLEVVIIARDQLVNRRRRGLMGVLAGFLVLSLTGLTAGCGLVVVAPANPGSLEDFTYSYNDDA